MAAEPDKYILAGDDTPADLELLTSILQAEGFGVISCKDGINDYR